MAWSTPTPPTADAFEALMEQAKWSDIETNDCTMRQNVTGPVPFCRATAVSGDVQIELTAAGPLQGGDPAFRITLRVAAR